MIEVFVAGIGVRGPGLNGWTASRSILAGAAPFITTSVALPAV